MSIKTQHAKRIGRVAAVLAAGATVATCAMATPSFAGTGSNGCLWISAPGNGTMSTSQSCGVVGYDHIQYFTPTTNWNGGTYYYLGGSTVNGKVSMSAANGAKVCAKLWHNNGNNTYTVEGFPCVTVG
jgi:hypothetical protein